MIGAIIGAIVSVAAVHAAARVLDPDFDEGAFASAAVVFLALVSSVAWALS
jgi:hypothetical protein